MQSTTSYLLLLKAKDTKRNKFTQSYFLHSALVVGLDETDRQRDRDMDATLWSHTVPGAEPGETVKGKGQLQRPNKICGYC